MDRRTFLAAGSSALGVSVAGCQGVLSSDRRGQPSVLEDRSDAVYVPTHVEGMEMAGMASAGQYRFALSYSFPHRFWLVTGERVRQVEVTDGDTMHLMLTAWDETTGAVVPTSNAVVTVSRNGEVVVSETSLWPMLSQNMGVHFGDNVALDGDGTYEVRVDFGPVETRPAGALAGRLDEQVSVAFEMEFTEATLGEVPFEELGSRAGEPDAVEPTEMDMVPAGQLSPLDELPGETLGDGTGGDAVFGAVSLPLPDGIEREGEGEGEYLAVSVRTPYNRYPLPFMSLSAGVTRDGETLFQGELAETLHPDIGYHYGTVGDSLRPGDEIRISVDAPPQIARHEGYETAFLEMDTVEVTV